MPLRLLAPLLLWLTPLTPLAAAELPPIRPIQRVLPPLGIEVPATVRAELEGGLAEVQWKLLTLPDQTLRADVEIFTKSVEFALRYGEFYDTKDFDKARWALQQAAARLAALARGEAPWIKQTGLVVRGFHSHIDGSAQPYGLVIPPDHDFDQAAPLYVWLHGRGDKQTDLHFLHERAHKTGEIAPPGAIVLHPFGRHCLGFKSAGGQDVFEALAALGRGSTGLRYDREQIALVGFSMGGAGTWLLGAHRPNVWRVVSPGAGFVETARYQKLKPEDYPPLYEQALWGQNDVPTCVRNLFNVPVIAYSGELDKQIQAARVMEEAYAAEGEKLVHYIGPGVGHKYHPETLAKILAEIEAILAKPREMPREVSVQTRTLAHGTAGWLTLYGLEEHSRDARAEGELQGDEIHVTTKNVTALGLNYFAGKRVHRPGSVLVIDDQTLQLTSDHSIFLRRVEGKWQQAESQQALWDEQKRPGMQGPIDDAFHHPFLVVLPDRPSSNPRVQQWVDFEIAHFRERWQATFRGQWKSKRGAEVNDQDLRGYNLICFGDPTSNALIARALEKLPLKWTANQLVMAGQTYDARDHVPLLVYRSPFSHVGAPARYLVLNSGPTFREAHDRTNSLQNSKLPDWAIVDITTPPNGEQPGKIVAADFFDEQWQVKK